MIICPVCKEEIEDDSHFCDQCGRALLYCTNCGRVGVGRRCTSCGGMMVSAGNRQAGLPSQSSMVDMSMQVFKSVTASSSVRPSPDTMGTQAFNPFASASIHVPTLQLVNDSLNIRIIGVNGAIIGRRQGPYTDFFQQNMYVSGAHAQLFYYQDSGWCVCDRHSSNGTLLNQRQLQPDMQMSLKNEDVLTIANVSLQVRID